MPFCWGRWRHWRGVRVNKPRLTQMREQDDHHGRLLAALESGERDVAAGRTVPYTPDLLKQTEQKARTHAANNRPANPDVIP